MTNQEFRDFRKQKQDDCEKWAIENYGSWDEFVESCFIDGAVFEIPVNILPPATLGEWTDAYPGGSYTDGPILVENSWLYGFCINDGHNRLKTYIKNGVESVKVKFIL